MKRPQGSATINMVADLLRQLEEEQECETINNIEFNDLRNIIFLEKLCL